MNNQPRFDRFRSLALDENLVGMAGMLDAGFDVNTQNDAHETALVHCCANDRLKSARFLASRGADLNTVDHGRSTPMDWAERHASRDFRDWLARAGGRGRDAAEYARGPVAG